MKRATSKLALRCALPSLAALALIAGMGCADEGGSGAASEDLEQTESGLTFTGLTLVNGWTNGPFSTRAAASALSSGIVYLRGAIATTGTNPVPFTLPVGRRPSTDVYLPINLCGATKGRLYVPPSGVVQVVAEGGAFSNAQCFTSLEGVSFAVSSAGFTPISVVNGWTNAPFSTRNAAVINIGDVIHLQGAIATSGTNPVPFTLPLGFAPSTNAYLPVDLCGGTKGRIFITLGGQATIVAENGTFSNAQCFTSLEGVSYPLTPASGSGFTCLPLLNGWTGMPFSTRNPCVKNDLGVIRLLGAVATSSGTGAFIQLPTGMRPSADTYVEADLFGGAQGRVLIQPSGFVFAQSKGSFSQAQGFTSIEGVNFGL
ncbi:MAG TPA: hypothetical protein VIU64_19035 [Polyangia bacterium]